MSRVTRVREEYEVQLEPLLEVSWSGAFPEPASLATELAAQGADPGAAGAGLGAGGAGPGQRPAAARLPADGQGPRRGPGQRRTAGQGGDLLLVLFKGYLLGIVLAFVLTSLAVSTQLGRDLLGTLTAMFNPLPAIAAAAGAALVRPGPEQPDLRAGAFGALGAGAEHLCRFPRCLGDPAHGRAQLRPAWPALRPADPGAGGAAVDSRRAEDRLGLRLAHADRRELVFGASSGKGGLGWYIFQNRNELYTDKVFAGLAVVVLIGLLVENLVFGSIERLTVKRWGVQR